MFKWRKPKIGEYIVVAVVFIILIGMLVPTCDFGHSNRVNQTMISASLVNLISNQSLNHKKSGEFMSVEEVRSWKDSSDWDKYGYDLIYESDKKSFKVWAVPKQYKKNGEVSFYADSESPEIHGAAHQGGKSNRNDPIVKFAPDK